MNADTKKSDDAKASKPVKKTPVEWVDIDENHQDQRIDNFLITRQKGVPKSLIYRILRKGEVRVNKKRVKPEYKLQSGDQVRIPPMTISDVSQDRKPSPKLKKVNQLESMILFEDDCFLILNKPSGIAVHGGSGLSFGVIEALRSLRPRQKFLELAHRLDRETSGCLVIAKKRSALKSFHEQLKKKTMQKNYLALVRGQWQKHDKVVNAPLLKKTLASGERIVRVHPEGKASETRYKIVQSFTKCTLVQASPVTGRTHQIRVHCQHAGHAIACDEKYGDASFDADMKKAGLQRLFLHAASLRFYHPKLEQTVVYEAPLPSDLQHTLDQLS